MEETLILLAVTISWIYLSYNIDAQMIKEYLHLVVAGNLITMVYFVYGISGTSDLAIYLEMSEIYLVYNVMAFIGFIVFYLLEWTLKYIRKKKREDIGFFDNNGN